MTAHFVTKKPFEGKGLAHFIFVEKSYISKQIFSQLRHSVAHFLQSAISDLSHSAAQLWHALAQAPHSALTSLSAFIALIAFSQAATHFLQDFSISAILGSLAHIFSTSLQQVMHLLQASMQALYFSDLISVEISDLVFLVIAAVAINPITENNKTNFFMILCFKVNDTNIQCSQVKIYDQPQLK